MLMSIRKCLALNEQADLASSDHKADSHNSLREVILRNDVDSLNAILSTLSVGPGALPKKISGVILDTLMKLNACIKPHERLDLAVKKALVDFMRVHGFDIHGYMARGDTLLDVAAYNEDAEFLQFLLENCASPEVLHLNAYCTLSAEMQVSLIPFITPDENIKFTNKIDFTRRTEWSRIRRPLPIKVPENPLGDHIATEVKYIQKSD
jgi:hypothetical protein